MSRHERDPGVIATHPQELIDDVFDTAMSVIKSFFTPHRDNERRLGSILSNIVFDNQEQADKQLNVNN